MKLEVSAEIGCAPLTSQPHRNHHSFLMSTVPHEFVTVDMRGLKTALVAHARERRVSVSVLVRDAISKTLPLPNEASSPAIRETGDAKEGSSLIKLSIRLTRAEVQRLDAGARAAGLSRPAFLSGLISDVSVLSSGGRREHLRALITSSAELSTLSRNIHYLTSLLRQSSVRAAQEYHTMLDTLADDVQGHLKLAAEVLAPLQPARRTPARRKRAAARNRGAHHA